MFLSRIVGHNKVNAQVNHYWREADLMAVKLRLTSPTRANYFALKATGNLQSAIDFLKASLG
jgi:hypothetical protein